MSTVLIEELLDGSDASHAEPANLHFLENHDAYASSGESNDDLEDFDEEDFDDDFDDDFEEELEDEYDTNADFGEDVESDGIPKPKGSHENGLDK